MKHKWDNENAMDYAVKTAVIEAEEKTREEERAKAERDKKETAIVLKSKHIPSEIIAEATGLSIRK